MQHIKYSNETFDQNADVISSLPTNKSVPSYDELKLMDTLFRNEGSVNNIVKEFKDSLLLGLTFILLSLPQIDELVKKFIPATTNSEYILLVVKGIIFGLLFWLIKNFGLIRKD
jgi:hypothetical protein